MKEVRGELFNQIGKYDLLCITTNGVVVQGRAVMGGGCAYEATKKWPGIDTKLGELIHRFGNVPHFIGYGNTKGELEPIVAPLGDYSEIWSFPTKQHFSQASKLTLVLQSAELMVKAIGRLNKTLSVVIPRPGCGLGGLNWEGVKKPLGDILDDRFTIITNDPY